ncbi:hypothetical protein B0H14DRAFT_1456216 [Mycena olivaceomarginata]|nr:hypothetical protein B0H14DRAFT_1456216 [Mycena olivaceomarginata]
MEPHPSSRASPPRSGANRVPAASAPSATTIQDSTVVPAPKLATESEVAGPLDGPSSPSPPPNSGPPYPSTDEVAESYDEVDDDWDTVMPPVPPANFFASSTTSFDIAAGTFNAIRPRGKPTSGAKPKPKPKPPSTPPESLEEHSFLPLSFPPLESPTVHPDPTQTRGFTSAPDVSRSYFRKYIRGAYISLIAPLLCPRQKHPLGSPAVRKSSECPANLGVGCKCCPLRSFRGAPRTVRCLAQRHRTKLRSAVRYLWSLWFCLLGLPRIPYWRFTSTILNLVPRSRKLDAIIPLRAILGRINHVIAAAYMDGLGCPQPCMLPHLTWRPNRNLRPSDPANRWTDRNRRPGRPSPQFHTQYLPTGSIYARDRVELLLRCDDPPPDS